MYICGGPRRAPRAPRNRAPPDTSASAREMPTKREASAGSTTPATAVPILRQHGGAVKEPGIRLPPRCLRLLAPTCHNHARRIYAMAKHGFQIIDAELHVMEPVD